MRDRRHGDRPELERPKSVGGARTIALLALAVDALRERWYLQAGDEVRAEELRRSGLNLVFTTQGRPSHRRDVLNW